MIGAACVALAHVLTCTCTRTCQRISQCYTRQRGNQRQCNKGWLGSAGSAVGLYIIAAPLSLGAVTLPAAV